MTAKSKEVDDFWKQPIAGFDPWACPGDAVFDQDTAVRICKFIEAHCRHSKGQFYGQLIHLEDWEKQVIGHLFGWKKPDGTRRFRYIFIYIPRKNGKTFLASCLIILLMKYDGELGADVYCCAAAVSQAGIVYDYARMMVLMDKDLKNGIKIWKATKTMEYIDKYGRTKGTAKVLSSDGDLILGTNPHAYIIDEVLAQKKFEVMENLESGTGTRRQPLGAYLSTAADDGHNPCNIKLDYAKLVRDGQALDPSYFPVIYETHPTADWKDEKVWAKVNPNLGVTVKLDFLRSEMVKALKNKADEIKFKRCYLNMQVSGLDSWLDMEDWRNCPNDINPEDLLGQDCNLALDLSDTSDICADVAYFPGFNACICFFYCPETAYNNKIEYAAMFKEHLRIMPGTSIDYDIIYNDIVDDISKKYKVVSIGFDPWHAKDLSKRLEEKKFDMVQIGQSAKVLTDPIRQLERQIKQKQLRHFNNPVLKWMAGNCFLWTDTNGKACKIIKKHKDSPAKIDGMIALVMAKAVADEQEIKAPSVYRERGMIVLG